MECGVMECWGDGQRSTQYCSAPLLQHSNTPTLTSAMARNRRNQSGAVRFVPALKAVLLCSLIGGFCVGYVLQKNKIFELGQQIGQRQQKLERLKKENQILADRLATMQLPQRLAERVRELRLGLVPPQPSQIIWISEPPASQSPTNATGLYYAQGRRGSTANP